MVGLLYLSKQQRKAYKFGEPPRKQPRKTSQEDKVAKAENTISSNLCLNLR